MFGLSLPKVLLLVLLVLVAWYGFRWFERMRRAARSAGGGGKNPAFRFFFQDAPERPPMTAEDTVRCRACGTYMPTKSAVSCGRGECPFPG